MPTRISCDNSKIAVAVVVGQRGRTPTREFGPLGVASVYGMSLRGGACVRAGHVADRDTLLRPPEPLPVQVDAPDELLLAVPRDTPLRFDASLGFQLYGADACFQASVAGRPAVSRDAVCFHNSFIDELPPAFMASAKILAKKWPGRRPLATPCAVITPSGLEQPPALATS